jgi:hypothetical protein
LIRTHPGKGFCQKIVDSTVPRVLKLAGMYEKELLLSTATSAVLNNTSPSTDPLRSIRILVYS